LPEVATAPIDDSLAGDPAQQRGAAASPT